MINKRGQVTIFIIIGILIIGGVSSYFVLKNSLNLNKVSSEFEPIFTNIHSCLEKTSKEGIEYLGMHGGYYEIPNTLSIDYFTDKIPYYYLNSKKYIPSIGRIEGELQNYILNHLNSCLDFKSFEEQGYKIKKGDLLILSNIKEDEIKINLDYPITITKGDSTKRLRKFETSIKSDLKKLIDASEEIVNTYPEKKGFVCLTCLEKISENNEVEITSAPFSNYEEDSIFFLITSHETELKWKFAVKI